MTNWISIITIVARLVKTGISPLKMKKIESIKVWKFADAVDKNGAMSFKLKDILSLRKNKTDKLNLFYSSSELPAGRTLATIAGDETGIARK